MPDVVETFIPNEESIVDFFSMTNEMKVQVIKLGLVFYKEGILQTQLWDNEKWETKLGLLEREHLSKVHALNQTLEQERETFNGFKLSSEKMQQSVIEGAINLERERYEKQLTHLQTKHSELLAKMNTLHTEIEERYSKKMLLSDKRYETQLATLQNNNAELLSKMNTLHTDIEQRYAEKILEMGKHHQSIMEKQYEKQQDLRNDYELRLSRQQNSSLKGKDGEWVVYERLNMLFPSAVIEDTHTTPHRGDFIVRLKDMVMMIETKNYSKNVQKSEIDKFYNDIDNPSNSDIQCGLFVSLNTGICNKEDFQFEIRNNIPVMFIHNLLDNFDSISLAVRFFRMILENTNLDLTHKETIDAFKNSASSLKRNFKKQKTQLDRYYNSQLEIISEQQVLVASLFGIVKQNF